jgi:hypothetical protein
MTIYEIKKELEKNKNNHYFFSRKTMKFFGQTMKSFKVCPLKDGRFLITAPMKDKLNGNKYMGETKRIFNPKTKNLDFVGQDEILI